MNGLELLEAMLCMKLNDKLMLAFQEHHSISFACSVN